MENRTAKRLNWRAVMAASLAEGNGIAGAAPQQGLTTSEPDAPDPLLAHVPRCFKLSDDGHPYGFSLTALACDVDPGAKQGCPYRQWPIPIRQTASEISWQVDERFMNSPSPKRSGLMA